MDLEAASNQRKSLKPIDWWLREKICTLSVPLKPAVDEYIILKDGLIQYYFSSLKCFM